MNAEKKPYDPKKQAYNDKYLREKTRQIGLVLNLNCDADILAKLDSVPNKQGYIKDLIRADIAAQNPVTPPGKPQNARKIWYAVMTGPDDTDTSYGSRDLAEAKSMALRAKNIYPEGYIAVIEDGPTPTRIDEIRDF